MSNHPYIVKIGEADAITVIAGTARMAVKRATDERFPDVKMIPDWRDSAFGKHGRLKSGVLAEYRGRHADILMNRGMRVPFTVRLASEPEL